MFISFSWSKPLIGFPVYFPSLLVPCIFSFISLSIAFTFSSSFQPYLTISVSFLITSVLNSASDRLAISSLLSYIFSGALICSFIWAIFFFVLALLLHSKGQSLKYLPGWVNPWRCVLVLYFGKGSEREQYHLLSSRQAFSHFLHYPQSNWALMVLIPG